MPKIGLLSVALCISILLNNLVLKTAGGCFGLITSLHERWKSFCHKLSKDTCGTEQLLYKGKTYKCHWEKTQGSYDKGSCNPFNLL
uniref:Secreted protein n=1 Tax=Globodera pallida TaxID=36090 RepID=A0A183CCG6_GLOPA